MALDIKQTVSRKDWIALVDNFLPSIVADSYSITEAMRIVGSLVNLANDEMEPTNIQVDFVRDYCVNLMVILRVRYPQEWKKDWKNEAFLGIACGFVYREEESFQYIQSAYQKLEDPPQSLILAYIGAGRTPDHPLSRKEIRELSKKALEKGVSYEVALRMSALYRDEGNKKEEQYWEKKAIEAEKNGVYTPIIVPNILKDICLIREGYIYEK